MPKWVAITDVPTLFVGLEAVLWPGEQSNSVRVPVCEVTPRPKQDKGQEFTGSSSCILIHLWHIEIDAFLTDLVGNLTVPLHKNALAFSYGHQVTLKIRKVGKVDPFLKKLTCLRMAKTCPTNLIFFQPFIVAASWIVFARMKSLWRWTDGKRSRLKNFHEGPDKFFWQKKFCSW